MNKIIHGDCLEKLKDLDDNSIDAICTDPPYGLEFMGKEWDYNVPEVEIWEQVLRVLKPGGHALVACGTRTQHRMAVNLEDAGFEIRDIVGWIYGSGFPKSHNIGKAVDKIQGNERELVGKQKGAGTTGNNTNTGNQTFVAKNQYEDGTLDITKGNSPWEGWGTALKPAMELWTLCRKPLAESTIAENVLEHGTGGMNIDGCRVDAEPGLAKNWERNQSQSAKEGRNSMNGGLDTIDLKDYTPTGRFPANLLHDGSDEATKDMQWKGKSKQRFFYSPKANKKERNAGLEGFEEKEVRGGGGRVVDGYKEGEEDLKQAASAYGAVKAKKANVHPTVKPIALMQYLCRLITPPEGTVLDPFMGSGTTGIAAHLEGFDFVGIEMNEEYIEIAKARIEHHVKKQEEKLF